jgi:transposase-like protein
VTLSSKRYVSYKDVKAVTAALKPIYKTPTEEQLALVALNELEQNRGDKYPMVVCSWREHWDKLSNIRSKYADLFIPPTQLKTSTASC